MKLDNNDVRKLSYKNEYQRFLKCMNSINICAIKKSYQNGTSKQGLVHWRRR